MKKLYLLLAAIVFVSCKKESNTAIQPSTTKAYIRVECVELSGESSYSTISVINIK